MLKVFDLTIKIESMKKQNTLKKFSIFILMLLFIGNIRATIHIIYVWSGYYIFVNGATGSNIVTSPLTVQLGDTIQFLPLDPPSMMHTVTSTTIPAGAAAFDQMWQLPADTFFQYVPAVAGVYNFECTPHVSMNMIGSFTVVSNSVGLDEISEKTDIKIYPNPTVNSINLTVSEKLIGGKYVLSDVTGKTFMTGEIISNKTLIDLSGICPGNYLLSVGDNSKKTFRLIKD